MGEEQLVGTVRLQLGSEFAFSSKLKYQNCKNCSLWRQLGCHLRQPNMNKIVLSSLTISHKKSVLETWEIFEYASLYQRSVNKRSERRKFVGKPSCFPNHKCTIYATEFWFLRSIKFGKNDTKLITLSPWMFRLPNGPSRGLSLFPPWFDSSRGKSFHFYDWY